MSELIGDVNAGPKPGTAFRTVSEEYEILDWFIKMMKKRVELEQELLIASNALLATQNENWVDSAVWPLISPLLSYLTSEIACHEEANKQIELCLAKINIGPSPNAHENGDASPLTILESLEELHNHYHRCHARIQSPESRANLKTWKAEASMEDASMEELVLPESEREYRSVVVKQQGTVDQAQDLLSNKLPAVLEQHQQRTEDVRNFSSGTLTAYSQMHSDLSRSCSDAVNSTKKFAPSRFSFPRHDEVDLEKSHPFMQKAKYRNYILDGQIARPLFGLGAHETVKMVKRILEIAPNTEHHSKHRYHPKWMFTAFDLEMRAVNTDIPSLLTDYVPQELAGLAGYAFSSDTPLAFLSREDLTRYRNGVPRARLTALIDQMMPVARREILSLKFQLLSLREGSFWDNYSRFAARALAHNPEAENIIENIWRKWDFDKHRPLPEGVQRVWNQRERKPEVVLRRTGRVYNPPT